MTQIRDVFFRKILDSRGNATIEVDVHTENGFGRAAAPSGASTGAHEVAAWPKGGVDQAIELAEDILAPELEGAEVTLQRDLDALLAELDGTSNFATLGGNTCVATSMAIAKAAADSIGVPLYVYLGGVMKTQLPRPLGNVLGGGAHAVGGTDIQEFMAYANGPSLQESVFANAFVHKTVKDLLKKELPGAAIGKGDEGAWVAPITNERAAKLVYEACQAAKDKFGFDVRLSLDVAATEFFKDGAYHYKDRVLKPAEQVDFMEGLVKDYNIFSIEDPFAEDDWESYVTFTKRVGGRTLIVGDDLFTTNPDRVIKGINMGAANAVLIKPNQIGTLTRTVDTVALAHEHGYKTIISHRSGETDDTTIAHLGVALGTIGIKTGAVGGERIAKLNELIRIEEEL
ncbi:MAG TPA: phosphopyruvate hydratase [Candidatus Thermoplasmatota archaeon]|nr:phosphopyruvate hydratase [Candidatus Thermoplasmatota archaeon]